MSDRLSRLVKQATFCEVSFQCLPILLDNKVIVKGNVQPSHLCMNISISQKWCGWGWDIHKGEISCFLIHYGLVSNCIVLCIQDVNLDTSVKTAGKYACMQYGMLKLATPITDHCPFSSHKTGPPESPCNIEKVRISTEMCDKG